MLSETEQEQRLVALAASPSSSERDPAFKELFALYRTRVFSLCFHLMGNRGDAEDAMQEIFFAVYRGLAAFRGEAKLSTWIYRIALRVALRVKAQRHSKIEPIEHEPPAPTPEDPAIARERREALAAALARLPAEHRSVISLFAMDGIPQKEIAAILGIPEGTVWSRLSSARKKLAAELARFQSPKSVVARLP